MKKICVINLKLVKLFVILIGSIVGVGFLTGAEIWRYFASYGAYGYIYLFLVMLLLYFILTSALLSTSDHQFNNKINNLLLISNILVAAAMMSGLNEIIKILFPNQFLIVFIFSQGLIFYILYKGINKLFFVDVIVLLFLFIIFILLRGEHVFINNILTAKVKLFTAFQGLFLSIFYIFMNVISFYNIIQGMQIKFTKSKSKIFSICLVFFIGFSIIYIMTFLQGNTKFAYKSMPLLEYFNSKKGGLLLLYSFGLILSLISTMVASLMCVKYKLLNLISNIKATSLVFLSSLILSVFTFKFYVIFIYPLIGFISLIVFINRLFFYNN